MTERDRPPRHFCGLEEILSRRRGAWAFFGCMARVLGNAYRRAAPLECEPPVLVLQGRVLRWLSPVFLFAQSGALLLAIGCLWSISTRASLVALGVAGCLLGTLQAVLCFFPEERLTVAPCSTIIRCLSVLIGLFWVLLLGGLFQHHVEASHLYACAASMALMATAGVLVPVAGAAALLAGIVGGGMVWALLRFWVVAPGSFQLSAALVVLSYLVFAILTFATMRVLFIGFLVNRVFLEQKNSILSLLLGDPDDTLGDWLWETDAEGTLCSVSPVFARAMDETVMELQNRSLVSVLARRGRNTTDDCHRVALNRLEDCMARRIFFRDLVICVPVEGGRQFWSLSGRPMFQGKVFHGYRGVGTDVTEAHHEQKSISFRARHDTLTGLPNRDAFFEDMTTYLIHAERMGESFALLNLDLDGFKRVNDRYGHHFGDRMLKKVAVLMSRMLGDGHGLYRIGGDEFILLEKQATERSAGVTAALLVEGLGAHPIMLGDGIQCRVGLSVGIVMGQGGGEGIDALLSASDLALYVAKQQGGNGYHFHKAGMESATERNRIMARDLASALKDGTVQIRYQPFLDAPGQNLLGFEALVYWRHPQYGRIMPEQMIHWAEEAGLIHELGLYVLDRAARFACTWPSDVMLSVNVSAGQVMREGFEAEWLDVLEKAGLSPERLQIEVTETIFLRQNGATSSRLHALRDRGIAIALDDFGKGYSCLSYLNFFPFSKIKLDRMFVRDMLHEHRAASIVKAVIGLSVDLGVAITAEGVETREQYDHLVHLGCTEVQGYFFGRPLKPEETLAMMQQGYNG